MTEAAEFDKIYKLEVVTIPTNKPMYRTKPSDRVYRTEKRSSMPLLKRNCGSPQTGEANAGWNSFLKNLNC